MYVLAHIYVWMLSRFCCVWLRGHVDCSLPGSSLHGILQARISEWVAMLIFRGSYWPRDQTYVSCLLPWQVGSLPLVLPGKPIYIYINNYKTIIFSHNPVWWSYHNKEMFYLRKYFLTPKEEIWTTITDTKSVYLSNSGKLLRQERSKRKVVGLPSGPVTKMSGCQCREPVWSLARELDTTSATKRWHS